MKKCTQCRADLPNGATMCQTCGAPAAHAPGAGQTRKKTVRTITFGAVVLALLGVFTGRLLYRSGADFLDDWRQERTVDRVTDYFTDSESWKEFYSPVGRFTASFPTYPEHEKNELEIEGAGVTVAYDSYSSVTPDGTAYIISISEYPAEIDTATPEVNLEGALNGMIQSREGNELVSSGMTTFGEYTAMEYHIQNPLDGVTLKGQSIMRGQTLYQMVVAYETNAYDDDAYQRFLDSLLQ